jgi:hypothetical protein
MEIDSMSQTISNDDIDVFRNVKNPDQKKEESSICMMYV